MDFKIVPNSKAIGWNHVFDSKIRSGTHALPEVHCAHAYWNRLNP